MIKIYSTSENPKVTDWVEQLDRLFLKYELIEQNGSELPRFVDGEKEYMGVPAIENYLQSQELFVAGWYEDRCDKYDFDLDALPKME